jgi:uncharacterized protein YndB with AHSA1/START domain
MSAGHSVGTVIHEVDTPRDRLELEAGFEGVAPLELFRYWTEPELLVRWWPKKAEIEATKGGSYHLSWPNMEWHLRGTYHTFSPGRLLVFTWRWDHEPDTPTRVVTLDFQPLEGEHGTRLHLTHGYYPEHVPKEMQERQGHLEGWHYFLGQLQTITGDSYSS